MWNSDSLINYKLQHVRNNARDGVIFLICITYGSIKTDCLKQNHVTISAILLQETRTLLLLLVTQSQVIGLCVFLLCLFHNVERNNCKELGSFCKVK